MKKIITLLTIFLYGPLVYAGNLGGVSGNLGGSSSQNIHGSAALNVLKAGDTMTGELNGTSLVESGSVTAGSMTVTGDSSLTGAVTIGGNINGASAVMSGPLQVSSLTVTGALSVGSPAVFSSSASFADTITSPKGIYASSITYGTGGGFNIAGFNRLTLPTVSTSDLTVTTATFTGASFSVGGSTFMVNSGVIGRWNTVPSTHAFISYIHPTNALSTPIGAIVLNRYFSTQDNQRGAAMYEYYNETSAQDQLVFGVSATNSPAVYSNAKMVIQSGGTVGIGSIQPVSKLTVSSGVLTLDGSGAGIALGGVTQIKGYAPVVVSSSSASTSAIAVGTQRVCFSTITATQVGNSTITVTGQASVTTAGGGNSVISMTLERGLTVIATKPFTLPTGYSFSLPIIYHKSISTAGAQTYAICITDTGGTLTVTDYDTGVVEY